LIYDFKKEFFELSYFREILHLW